MSTTLNEHKSHVFFPLSIFICADYQRSFTLKYKSMFSTFGYTYEGNTASLVKKWFKLCFDFTYFQIVAIFGLFATLPFVRRLSTGQCEGKECVRVVKAHSEETE